MAKKTNTSPAPKMPQRTLANKFPFFVFTSCLCTTAFDNASAEISGTQASMLDHFDPQLLPEKEFELLKLSVDEIVDEFFSHDMNATGSAEQIFAATFEPLHTSGELQTSDEGGRGGEGGHGEPGATSLDPSGGKIPATFEPSGRGGEPGRGVEPGGRGVEPGGRGGEPGIFTPSPGPIVIEPGGEPSAFPATISPGALGPSPGIVIEPGILTPSPGIIGVEPGGRGVEPGGRGVEPGGRGVDPDIFGPEPGGRGEPGGEPSIEPGSIADVAYEAPPDTPPDTAPDVVYDAAPDTAYDSPPYTPGGYDSGGSYEFFYYDSIYGYVDPCYDSAGYFTPPAGRAIELPLKPAEPEDVRYRDLCVTGSELTQADFDPQTGDVLAPDLPLYGFGQTYDYGGYEAESLSVFEQKFVGTVSGSKPPIGQCMPMKDTPKVDLSINATNANRAFAYYMNLQDTPFFTNPTFAFDPHGASNYYRDKTFFVGGTLGCPNMGEPGGLEYLPTTHPTTGAPMDLNDPSTPKLRSTIPLRAEFHKFRAELCYNYYIINRALKPWYALERPLEGTDDPYTMVDPRRAFHNTCQPIVGGDHARAIQHAAWLEDPLAVKLEKQGGFDPEGGYSKVVQWEGRPDIDEAEYLLSTYLERTWEKNFENLIHPNFRLSAPLVKTFPRVGLPCIIGNKSDSLAPTLGGDSSGAGPLCDPSAGGGIGSGCDVYFPLPEDVPYHSPFQGKYYCPNVEKINEPDHPFSPRHDITTRPRKTDRIYSHDTSFLITACGKTRWGYTHFNAPWRTWYERWAVPAVQCGLVPVDILSFRQEQFHICMMQRIKHNFNDWIDSGLPNQLTLMPRTWEGDWVPPCKTRYYQEDEFAQCPVKYSAQQCCRIVVKDVVPANFVKMRTCEGLKQKRRDDAAIQTRLAMLGVGPLTPLAPWTHITNESFGGYSGPGHYSAYYSKYYPAKWATYKLNTVLCDNTEPNEYRFDHFFDSFSENLILQEPSVPPGDSYYMGEHMPYMRWWDTGVSAGNPRHGGGFVNVLGSFDTVIGIGREERDIYSADQEGDYAQARGANGQVVGRIRIPHAAETGRIGGWAELKAHQMHSVRRNNLFCLGRYERLFKPGSADNFVLAKAGAGYTSREGVQWPWPLGWRGYVSDTHGREFPGAFEAPGAARISGGLDNALPGDIIVYEVNGLKQLAYVADIGGYAIEGSDDPLPDDTVGVFDFNISRYRRNDDSGEILHPTRIFVLTWDQNKFPSSTGISINLGIGPERTIYKQEIPDVHQADVCKMDLRALTDKDPTLNECRSRVADDTMTEAECLANDCQPSCLDGDYAACVLPNSRDDWNTIEIYRPYFNVRRCNGTPSDATFSLNDTYDWQTNTDLTLSPPSSSVIYQGMTQQFDTNLWAMCVNSGFDAPAHYNKDYKGPQTGAMTDTTLCEAEWWEDGDPYITGCSSTADENEFFPE